MKSDMYCPQVCPEGGLNDNNSLSAQTMLVLATATLNIPSTRYVNGETRYIKIQKWGKESLVARTLTMEKRPNQQRLLRQRCENKVKEKPTRRR